MSDRAYTADAVQKLFSASANAEEHASQTGFRAVGLLADYAEVREDYETAIEQFLREELEYVVVETFDHARSGISMLREEVGGRAAFFVDSLSHLNLPAAAPEAEEILPQGVLSRLDALVEFRDPLGPAAKHFLSKLRAAFLVESAAVAEHMAQERPSEYFLTPDGSCYHGRIVSGGRESDAGPLALKRELRQHESEVLRLEAMAQEQQVEIARIAAETSARETQLAGSTAQHLEAEKSLVAAAHQREQARTEHLRIEQQLGGEHQEIARLRAAAEAARLRADEARREHAEALRLRAEAEAESTEASEKLGRLRHDFQVLQERLSAQREEIATLSERLTSAESIAARMSGELDQAQAHMASLRQQHEALTLEKAELESSCGQLAGQVADLRIEKNRLEENKASLEREWEEARTRAGQLEESLRGKRTSLEEIRNERGQRQIEKARNDADREYLRQTCINELNAQPEELMAQ
ncbi:MAG: hypothetical protein ACRD4M_03920, partial [Candidatus Acidiferrales bacterium]